MNWIKKENLWNIWVPKTYGGLESSLTQGLTALKELAKIDGSLGWTVTLCSGANYFIGNLQPGKAKEIFLDATYAACFGGSGGVSGTAEIFGDSYQISGIWHYATGAPYLTHFTLNAEIVKKGSILKNEDGSPKVLSFIVPKDKVRIIDDWNTMGLKATATQSFEVKDVLVHKSCAFLYNKYYLPQPIFKIGFSVFADLTLWANYIGMAEHLLEEAISIMPKETLCDLEHIITDSNRKMFRYAKEVENRIMANKVLEDRFIHEIHKEASVSVQMISKNIIGVFPGLGVKASRENHALNQIFRDYFTATQHHIFSR
ncbi:acyl-CoA dehydrogenase [Maribacter sp. ANRC-HE7]|uniref:Acyl-CoA dehydrogenase n=1 Tax=Maribacter aquimaris TaxID=2737171 RepID=A0ABR7UZ95_9FLAO|nr:acyl-CoA dehydrogenase [Maribacter aquimaris]